ncbi:MAG: hypothetical protein Q9179_007684 [Wetmoreana sp. 5 TL-2023]
MSDSSAQVLYLRLGDDAQIGIFNDLYESLQSQIDTKYSTTEVKSAAAVKPLLSSPSLKAILVVDGGLSGGRCTALQTQLARYIKAGGTLIFCCLFSSFVSPLNADRLWSNFAMPWKFGDYHRSTFYLSQKATPAFGNQRAATLEREYSMKAVHLKDSTVDSKIYVPLEQSRVESMVFAPRPVDQSQSPAVWAKCGEGWLGFIGDVNNEQGSQKLLMVMLGKFWSNGRWHRPDHNQVDEIRNGHEYELQCR